MFLCSDCFFSFHLVCVCARECVYMFDVDPSSLGSSSRKEEKKKRPTQNLLSSKAFKHVFYMFCLRSKFSQFIILFALFLHLVHLSCCLLPSFTFVICIYSSAFYRIFSVRALAKMSCFLLLHRHFFCCCSSQKKSTAHFYRQK